MPYIGKQPTVGNFQVCDAISVVNGQAAYTMQVGGSNVEPESANHMLVSLNGILQKPGSSFTISGSTITFASNLATGDVIDFITLLGDTLNTGVPSDDTVTAAKLNDDIISGQTALTAEPDDTDEFLVSDAGTIKRIDYSLIKGGQGLVKLTNAAISSATSFSITSTHITSTYKFYDLVIEGSTPSGSNDWFAYLQTSTDNGSSYDSGGTSYKWTTLNTGTQGSFSSVYDQDGDSSLRLISAASDILDFTTTIRMFSPTDSSKYTNFVGSGMGGHQSNDDAKPAFFIGVNRVHQAVNNIKVTFSTAFTGNYYFYGVTA